MIAIAWGRSVAETADQLMQESAKVQMSSSAYAELRHRPAAHARQTMRAFPNWILRIECDRCGKVRMISETHIPMPDTTLLREILDRMRHDGCGGRAGKAELLTGIEGVSSRPVRKIVLRGG